jgi:hypothetical protein
MSGDKLHWALQMAERGRPVFPVEKGASKPPLLKDWPNKATTDEQQIREWWSRWPDANIGIHCTGLIVVDVDIKNGKQGEASAAALGLSEDTFSVTTPSGGRHLYFRGPNVANTIEQLGPGLDVRSDHGYVVGPGSTVGGKDYLIRYDTGIAEADAGLVGRLQALNGTRHPSDADRVSTPVVPLDAPAAVARAEAFLLEAPLSIEGVGGDQTAYRVACTLKDFGLSEFTAWELMSGDWNDRCSPPWSLEELEQKVRNAYAYGQRPPGIESPELGFKDVKIEPPPRTGRKWHYPDDELHLNQNWLFHKLLPATGFAVLVGTTGAGKTFVIAHLVRCLGLGQAFFGVDPEERGASLVLFAGTEGSGFAHRIAAMQETETIPVAFTHVSGLRQRGALDALLADLQDQQAYMLQKFGVPLRVVFLETLSASGLIDNENDNAVVAQAVENLTTIGRALGVLFVTTHHPPKHGEGTRGAEALPSNSDYVLEITRYQKAQVREISLTKARNAAERKLGTFSLVEVEIGRDDKDRPVTSMAISTGDIAAATREKKVKHAGLFLECIDDCIIADDVETVDVNGVPMVDLESVKEQFKIRSGVADARNRRRYFSEAQAHAEGLGLIAVVPHMGDTLICRKEITL